MNGVQSTRIKQSQMDSSGNNRTFIHDCNNLLTVIIFNLQLAEGRSCGDLQLHDRLSEARKAAIDVAHLIKGFSLKLEKTSHV